MNDASPVPLIVLRTVCMAENEAGQCQTSTGPHLNFQDRLRPARCRALLAGSVNGGSMLMASEMNIEEGLYYWQCRK